MIIVLLIHEVARGMPSLMNQKDGSRLVRIPDGAYDMGSDIGTLPERPPHTVSLPSFDIAQHPVTNAQYQQFVAETGYRIPYLDDARVEQENWDQAKKIPPTGREDHPVVLVNWHDAQAYCTWAGGRLATEAEWEQAARGGLVGKPFPWGDDIDRSRANYDNPAGTTPVGAYPANPYDLYDMAGNVWEWVADWYGPKYYAVSPNDNPKGPESGAAKVLRGGAWLLFPEFCRVSYRFRNSPNFRSNLIGFRLAMSV